MEEGISLEETNAIRIKLGLKPLADDSEPADDKDIEAESNYARKREEEAKERERKRIEQGIAKVKNKRELNASLKGSTLGDADAEGDDTMKWIKKSKKREKELAKKRIKELEDMDKRFQGDEYGEKDLEGLKVGHDLDELQEGDERVLTLKDSRILDNEEDELQNVEMAELERERKNKELKIKKRDYTGYDDEEFTGGHAGMKKAVLSKYDEFLEGPEESGFRLGASTQKPSRVIKDEEQKSASASINKSLLSIDYEKNMEINDYLQEGDVGFKKPKTKKKRPTRRIAEDSGIDLTANGEAKMDVDEKPTARTRNLDTNFVDDDELQASLARARRAKTLKPKVQSQEEIARRLIQERAGSQVADDIDAIKVEDDDNDGVGAAGLTFDDTSEFVRAITYNPIAIKEEVKQEPQQRSIRSQTPQGHGDVPMNGVDETVEELEAGELLVKEEVDDDEEMLHALEAAIHTAEATDVKVKEEGNGDLEVGTSAEQSLGSGLAAALNILRQQGVLAAPTADQQERERIQRQRDLWMADYRTRIALREVERLRSRGEKKDQAQREYENRLREQQEARQSLELHRDYKPDVNIVYHDEFGRELTPKEAWKALSHRFHGKGSGKMKTEKRLKKIADEKKKEAMASGETPLSMNRAFQMRQEKTGQAHFVLSVGNRGSVPQASEFLDPPTLSKGKTEKAKKKKESAKDKAPIVDMTGFMALGAAMPSASSVSPGPGSRDSPAPSMMKSSFSQVLEPASANGSGTGTPVNGTSERTRVAFGLKRKAGGEGEGTPPSKRR